MKRLHKNNLKLDVVNLETRELPGMILENYLVTQGVRGFGNACRVTNLQFCDVSTCNGDASFLAGPLAWGVCADPGEATPDAVVLEYWGEFTGGRGDTFRPTY